MAAVLPSYPEFVITDDPSIATKWEDWLDGFEAMILAMKIINEDEKRNMLMHYLGTPGRKLIKRLDDIGEVGKDDSYKKPKVALNKYFKPKFNRVYLMYMMHQTEQGPSESIDSFYIKLCDKMADINLEDLEKNNIIDLIKLSQMVNNCKDKGLKKKAIRDGLSVTDFKQTKQGNPNRRKCFRCAGEYPHEGDCPAINYKCAKCNLHGHYTKQCRTSAARKMLNQVMEEELQEEYEEEYITIPAIFRVGMENHKNVRNATIKIKDQDIMCLLDTGAEVNIIGENTFLSLGKYELQAPKKKLCAYGSRTALPVLGCFQELVKAPKTKLATVTDIYVMKGETGNLLGCQTAEKLGLVSFVNQVQMNNMEEILHNYQDRFHGMGKMDQLQVHLNINKDVTPIAQKSRRIPFHLRERVDIELKRLKEMDIIEDAEGSTPWVSPVVVVHKPNDQIRICLDSRAINTAIERERYPMNTIEDLIVDLNGSKIFSKIDLNKGYHQLELAKESRYITTFATHNGLYRYKRLCFGINSAAEIFQKEISQMIQGIPGVKNMSDDIIIYSKTRDEHMKTIQRVLQRLRDHNITANKDKCQFVKEEILFFGHVFSKNGISPSEDKISAIKNASPPQSSDEVRSLLGMAQYVARFCPNYSSIVDPLRKLTRKDILWNWGPKQKLSFKMLKESMANWKMIRYFDTELSTELIVDASPFGLGAILTQKTENENPVQVIEYASCALTDTESRYSQTERELLAVVWACEHFNHYLEGSEFIVVTDHKPLEGITKKVTSLPTARIHRLCLRLQPYKMNIVYRPGKTNPADYLSRHLEQAQKIHRITWLDVQTESVIVNAINEYLNHGKNSVTRQELEIATAQDEYLQEVIKCIASQSWHSLEKNEKQYEAFKRIREELSVSDGLVLRGDRVVIPEILQGRVVAIAHASHQGIVKTEAMIRETVWFAGIDRLVENTVMNCLPCQANSGTGNKEPLKMTNIPSEPWREVSVDFCGPFKTGEYLLVVMDDYSRFPEVEIVYSTSTKATLPKLDAIFARQGIPEIVKSDNGPPFNGDEFASWAKLVGFQHRKITPLWPQANGEAERFMRTLAKAVRAAMIEKGSWKQELYTFLRHYRATPHSTTGMSPCEMLNKRKLKTEVPVLAKKRPASMSVDDKIQLAEKKDYRVKVHMKELADDRNKAKENELVIGDKVLVRQPKGDKLSTPYRPEPYEVIQKHGSMVTAKRGQKTITRNSSHMKKIPEYCGSLSPNSQDEFVQAKDVTPGQLTQETCIPLENNAPVSAESEVPGTPKSTESVSPRRSTRQCRTPGLFKDFVR